MTMYTSTRGGGELKRFGDIVLKGLASNGGLYVPAQKITIDEKCIRDMSRMTYPEVAFQIMTIFAPDIPKKWWRETLHDVYTPEVFGNHADKTHSGELLPIRRLGDKGIFVADLSTGPTLAFKDWALQLLARLFAREAKGRRLTIIGATSGDTGSAAIEALRGQGIPVFMLSPVHGMSEFQKAQMYSVKELNVHNISIRGTFDECQRIVKELNNDALFKSEYGVGAVNSINWARIAAQIAYYFFIYASLWDVHKGRAIDVAVPSGNFGNAYAGIMARAMGLNIGRIIVATNANDVLYEFWETGTYKPRAETVMTMSPSMDITAASNLERLIFDAFGDSRPVSRLYKKLKQGGLFNVQGALEEVRLRMMATMTTEDVCARTIYEVHQYNGFVIDPHTAVAVSAAARFSDPLIPMVALSTAQPCKFDNAIQRILGIAAPRPPAFQGIESRKRFVTTLNPDTRVVKEFVISALGG